MPENGGRVVPISTVLMPSMLVAAIRALSSAYQRDGKWQDETVTRPLKQMKAWMDGKIMPFPALSLKPGRR